MPAASRAAFSREPSHKLRNEIAGFFDIPLESNDSYPVFHTRLARTQCRRLLKLDGSSAGWLIVNAADSFATVTEGFVAESGDLIARVRGTDEPAAFVCDTDEPPQLAIPSQR